MQIDAVHELELSAADDAAIGALLDAAYADLGENGFQGRSYFSQRHHLRIVAREDDRIIGHVALLFRVIRLGDTVTPVIGLAEVATDPAREGRGVASLLLNEAISRSRDSIAAFIVLFGDHPIYRKSGFLSRTNLLRHVVIEAGQTREIRTGVDDALMILPLTDADWPDDVTVDLMGPMF